MSDWISVLAVFWVLWILDGARVVPRRIFTVVGGVVGRIRISYGRLSLPGVWPGSWRIDVSDVPLALSPTGVSNRPAGSAGRPAETPVPVRAWRWEEVRVVGVARGLIFVNGERFCADTGHVKAPELLELVRLSPSAREKMIVRIVSRWFRPAQLRRSVRVLAGRTIVPAELNTISFVGLIALTIYVAADLASSIPVPWSERMVALFPWLLLGLLILHLAAVVTTWQAVRQLKSVRPEKRASALWSALLLPPQALRLRSLAGDGFFPVQHPVATALVWGDRRAKEEWAFSMLADLRWPIGTADDPTLAREVALWFRATLEGQLVASLTAAGIVVESLLVAPRPDTPRSCSYCPRCRDQFVDRRPECPNGVPLRPLGQLWP